MKRQAHLKYLAHPLLYLSLPTHLPRNARYAFITSNGKFNGKVKEILHTLTLLTRALAVECPHACGDLTTLLSGDGRHTLRFEKLETGAVGAKVSLEADEDDGSVGTEVQNLRVPLPGC